MVKKGLSNRTVSKVSSAAAPSTLSATLNTNKSSILHSAFSPSRFQLSLFASVIHGLDSQHLRLHDTNTGRLKCEHAVGSKASITCLNWGRYNPKEQTLHQSLKKKRKRSEETNGLESDRDNVTIAFGTSESEIHIFSPSEAKVVGVLKGGHVQGIRDFKFAPSVGSNQGWSLGGDGKLVQWDLQKGISTRTIPLPTPSASTLLPLDSFVLCASSTTYLIDPDAPGQAPSFQGSVGSIHTLLVSYPNSLETPSTFLAAAESDRYVNIFDIQSRKIIGSLVAGSYVKSLVSLADDLGSDLSSRSLGEEDIVAAVTEDGIVEIFLSPFDFENKLKRKETAHIKPKRAQKTHNSTACVKVVRPDRNATEVPILNASFEGDNIVMVWAEGGMHLTFERVQWRDGQTGALLLTGTKEVIKAKSTGIAGALATNGVKNRGLSQVDESRTVVARGGIADSSLMTVDEPEVIDISSAEEESESDLGSLPVPISSVGALTNGEKDGDVIMQDGGDESGEKLEDTEEPSFGDLIRSNAPDIIDVTAAFANKTEHALAPMSERNLQLPSGMSLGTVLTQALRTNDVTLLETCLHVGDLNMIRATIERLNSSLAAALLQKLAERLHSRPGRAGSLMVWIQWTLVTHGGYLASQPDVVKKLTSLHRVIKERANSLQPLLSLKGKLDMLEAQMNFRRSIQRRFQDDERAKKEDEEAVIYVEGQDSSSEDDSDNSGEFKGLKRKTKESPRLDENGVSSESDGDVDNMPTNGIEGTSESENEESDSDSNLLVDQEASETDDDSGDDGSEDEVDYDDNDSIEDEDELIETDEIPNARLSNGNASKKGEKK